MIPSSGRPLGPNRPKTPLVRKPGTPISKKQNPFASGFKKFSLKKQHLSWSIAAYVAMIGVIVSLTVFLAVYLIYLSDLPPIEELESAVTPQSSVIYDKSGKEIYRFYDKENRTYVPLSSISQPMKDAIISIEDKTFFENPGFDFRGLVRAGLNYVLGRTDKIQGTSTLSQQLIRASFLSNERTFDRKIKEAWLTFRLGSSYSKEKVLEFYLNKISFGNNAYGIEEASKTYFGKSSKDLGILGSAILASIPKGPTFYSPYTHRDRLMGYLYVFPSDKPDEQVSLETKENKDTFKPLSNAFFALVKDLEFTKKGSKIEVCGITQDFLKKKYSFSTPDCASVPDDSVTDFLNSIQVKGSTLSGTTVASEEGMDNADYYLEYNTGRKDLVLANLLADGKITGKEFKDAFVGGFDLVFKKAANRIKYPYFVFYVKEYLENIYGKDFDVQGGLKIYTTLDPKLQDKAQELIEKQKAFNKSRGATNAALVSMDNKTGHVLAMVGGLDYFADTDGANVNIITAKRQPGSSFKPIEYALAIAKHPIGPETPLYDVKTDFGNWEPDNYDGKFHGRMTVKTALGNSRNIPAIKVFMYAGGEDAIVKFANTLGIKSLLQHGKYGMPLAIGTWEIKPLELMSAYSVFANGGVSRPITPILKIEDKKGNIIEDNTKGLQGTSVFSDAASYIISAILSDSSSRPSGFWNNALTLAGGRVAAAKTGTSNKDVSKGKEKKILPADLWTAGYTPQITTVVWAGNTDGSATLGTADGLNCAAPIWKEFMNYAHTGKPVEKFVKPDSVYTATISRISGRKATASTPENMRVTTMFAVAPEEFENSVKEIEIDTLCGGKVTESTPQDAIKKGYLVSVSPVIESYNKTWLKGIQGSFSSESNIPSGNIFFSAPAEACERPGESDSSISVATNIAEWAQLVLGNNKLEVSFRAKNKVQKIQIYRDGELYRELVVDGKTEGRYTNNAFKLDASWQGKHEMKIKIVDEFLYSNSVSANVVVGDEVVESDTATGDTGEEVSAWDTSDNAPVITMKNPPEGDASINIYQDQFFNLRFNIASQGVIKSVNIYIDGVGVQNIPGGTGDFLYTVNENKDTTAGNHTLVLEVVDENLNKATKTVQFAILAR